MSGSNIKVKRNEAVHLLELRAKELMLHNKNWQYISVVDLQNERGFGWGVGVYDLEEEREIIEMTLPKRKNIQFSDQEIYFDLPINIGASQSRLKRKTMSVSYPEVDIQICVVQVQFKDQIDETDKDVQREDDSEQRVMGHLLNSGYSNSGEGALGGILLDIPGMKFAITAFHVVERTRSRRTSDPIIVYSPDHPFNRKKLGEVFWHQKNSELDITLIAIEDQNYVASGSLCPGIKPKPHLGKIPRVNDKVRICSSSSRTSGQVNTATVQSLYSVVRRDINGVEIALGRIQTSDLGRGGDSGSLVLNMQNEVVGMLAWDVGTKQSYFMPLEILKTPLEGEINNQSYTFEFNQFLQ